MRIESEIKLDFKDVLIRPKRSTLVSRSDVSLERTYTFKHSGRSWTGVPIVASNMDTTGTIETSQVLSSFGMGTTLHKHIPLEEYEKHDFPNNPKLLENVFISCGIKEHDLEKLDQVLEMTQCKNICIDVANGYTEFFISIIRKIRAKYPTHTIMAGNVVTGEMTEALILSGVDIVKVGIGPGSVCLTRKLAGVGYPQLSAVIECADAAHGLGGLIVADGGCTNPGDIAKAFGAGADYVMLGGMLAGHTESGGELITKNGIIYKTFYGMSSPEAMNKYSGGVAQYRASEGKCVELPYRGPLAETVKQILGGLRSACTYVGASALKELSKRTTFVRVSQQLNNIFS
uniref:GMP reductase n=1 Tax=Salmo salar TaxID=8030 RepID=B5X9I1_SALSA|nr:GMP reductase [Salmo salar]ACI67501.1 GMP reductase [Salmo salar]